MSAQLAEAPPRALPAAVSVRGGGSSAIVGPLHVQLQLQPRGVVGPSSTAAVAAGGALTSASSHASFLASLAAPPAALVAPRAHADPAYPILVKEHSAVYARTAAEQLNTSRGNKKQATEYVLRPNFRTLQESDSQSTHASFALHCHPTPVAALFCDPASGR